MVVVAAAAAVVIDGVVVVVVIKVAVVVIGVVIMLLVIESSRCYLFLVPGQNSDSRSSSKFPKTSHSYPLRNAHQAVCCQRRPCHEFCECVGVSKYEWENEAVCV